MADLIKIESFEKLDLETSKKIVERQTGPREISNWLLYNDNHWQDADLWTGPALDGDSVAGKTVMAEVEKQFVYINVSREIVISHVNAPLSTPPSYGAVLKRTLGKDKEGNPEVPTDTESAAILELDSLLTEWSDNPLRGTYTDRNGTLRTCSLVKLIKRAAEMYVATGRANLRLFVPPRKLGDDGKLKEIPLAASLKRIYIELCEPGLAAVYPDRDRMQSIGIYCWKEGSVEKAEFSYVSEDADIDGGANTESVITILRQISTENNAKPIAFPMAMDGYLTFFEMCDDPLLLDSIISNQKSLNKTLTMGDRAMNLAGFPERILKSVQLNGSYIDDPTQPTGKKFIPDPIEFGPATVNVLNGPVIKDEEGKIIHAPEPDYEKGEASGTTVFDESAREARARMLNQAFQTYVLMDDDATASGKSRETARDRFKKSVAPTMAAINSCGLWLYNAALGMARATSNEKTKYTDLRVDFQCLLDMGALSAVERQEDREQVKVGAMSRQRAMERGGIEDVDAEDSRIGDDNEKNPDMILKRAQIFQTLTAGGAPHEAAAIAAGFSKEVAKQLAVGDFVAPDENEDESPESVAINPDALKAGIQADKTLNGAQITAALDIFDRLSGAEGTTSINPKVAVELLAAVGIPRDVAQTMVSNSRQTG